MTEEDQVSIIPATADHAQIAAKLNYETDEDYFDFWFGGDHNARKECFQHWWRQDTGLFSHSLAIAAMCEGRLQGIEIGYDRATEKEHLAATWDYASEVLSTPLLEHLQTALTYVPFLLPYKPPGCYYVQSLAVTQTVRGRGIGKSLLGEAIRRATSEGYKSCHLDVVSGSPAVEFYRSMGMFVLSESRIPRLEEQYRIGAHYRMVKQLKS